MLLELELEFIPLGELQVPNRNEKNKTISDIVTLHEKIKESNQHNFLGKQIRVNSQLNSEVWVNELRDYWDSQLCNLITYGFPLDFDHSQIYNVIIKITTQQ